MCKLVTEIKAIESGQKDALLRRANIKKIYIYFAIYMWYEKP
jgi:hypothetical protein